MPEQPSCSASKENCKLEEQVGLGEENKNTTKSISKNQHKPILMCTYLTIEFDANAPIPLENTRPYS
jgi:hypothetical protein